MKCLRPKIGWQRLSAITIVCAVEFGGAQAADWVGIDNSARAFLWRSDAAALATEQRSRIGIASDASGRLQIGFKHSGYTSPDPDGRNAFLTVTLVGSAAPLSMTEKQLVEANGAQFDPSVTFTPAQGPTLDVTCTRCPDVASQIRAAAGLPKVLPATGGSLPIQIRLKDIPGPALYEILTAPDGLWFQLTVSGTLARNERVTTRMDPNRFDAWWQRYASGDVVAWSGGSDPLIFSLMDSGVLVADSRSRPASRSLPSEAYVGYVRPLLAEIVNQSGTSTVTRAALTGIHWMRDETIVYRAPVSASVSVAPGIILKDHPEYVEDLTDGQTGLEALKAVPATNK